MSTKAGPDRIVDFHTHVFPPEIIRDRESFARRDAAFGLLYGNPRSPMATVEDVALLRAAVGWSIGVKASGGIRDRATAEAMLAAGATRIGTSSGPAIIAPPSGISSGDGS